jgi:uncharacterized membrane protein YdjX (TVP38/TMEM64 family)
MKTPQERFFFIVANLTIPGTLIYFYATRQTTLMIALVSAVSSFIFINGFLYLLLRRKRQK